ncbi:MAG: Acid stress protein IbaG [Gammaproteobacteria bacterium]|nr:Acid stress protein IbaG [Gammaproteobacteria bacterium]
MITPERIKQWIESGLPGSRVEIAGDGRHFQAIVLCEEFAGRTRIQQHQMVYDALGDKMEADIHALSLRTMTPDQWDPQSK